MNQLTTPATAFGNIFVLRMFATVLQNPSTKCLPFLTYICLYEVYNVVKILMND